MNEPSTPADAASSGDLAAAAAYLNELFTRHADHPWHQVGRCVYCGPCGERLYQGTMPADHPRWTPPRRRTASDEMRERWGKD